MKVFLITVTIREAEHDHSSYCLKRSHSKNAAEEWAERECANEVNGYWSFGDDPTLVDFEGVREITEDEAKVVEDLGLAFFA